MKEVLLFLIQGIPEMTGVIALCFAIARVQIKWTQTLLAGVGAVILSYTIQSLSFFFGFHTLLLLFLIMFYVAKTAKISIIKSFFVTSITTLILGLLEFSTNSLYFGISNINPQDITSDNVLWTFLGMPQAIIILLLAFSVSRIFKPVEKESL